MCLGEIRLDIYISFWEVWYLVMFYVSKEMNEKVDGNFEMGKIIVMIWERICKVWVIRMGLYNVFFLGKLGWS